MSTLSQASPASRRILRSEGLLPWWIPALQASFYSHHRSVLPLWKQDLGAIRITFKQDERVKSPTIWSLQETCRKCPNAHPACCFWEAGWRWPSERPRPGTSNAKPSLCQEKLHFTPWLDTAITWRKSSVHTVSLFSRLWVLWRWGCQMGSLHLGC